MARPAAEVDRHGRASTHGVDVGQRVGRSDPSPVARVVDDGDEEVRGEDECALVVEPVDRGVVAFEGTDEQVARRGLQVAAEGGEHALQFRERQFARTARSAGQRRQLDHGLDRYAH
jgi:hypothetical protein